MTTAPAPTRTEACWLTAETPGAIAVLMLTTADAKHTLQALGIIGTVDYMRPSHRRLAGIDDGVVLRTSESTFLIMPHGGPAIRAKLTELLIAIGVEFTSLLPLAARPSAAPWESVGSANLAREMFPEAADTIEALALLTLSMAHSPRAIPAVMAQVPRWRQARQHSQVHHKGLDRLLRPPLVAVVGAPNAGKSTLTNRLAGRTVSIEWHEPGSTVDHVGVLIELDGLVVKWIDTPGIGSTYNPTSDDGRDDRRALEAEAQAAALRQIQAADLVVSMAEVGRPFLQVDHPAVVKVRSKSDLVGEVPKPAGCTSISALTGAGIDQVARQLRQALLTDAQLADEGLWLFHPGLPAARAAQSPMIE